MLESLYLTFRCVQIQSHNILDKLNNLADPSEEANNLINTIRSYSHFNSSITATNTKMEVIEGIKINQINFVCNESDFEKEVCNNNPAKINKM